MGFSGVTDTSLFAAYRKKASFLKKAYSSYGFEKLDFDFLISASAVYSSNIEGNSVDLNSFMNYQSGKKKRKTTKEIAEIEDLIGAYRFAQTHALTEKNLLKTHDMLAKRFVIPSHRGKYRVQPVGVFGSKGLVYLAVEPDLLKTEMTRFWSDIALLRKRKLSLEQVFYFASHIHLVFAHLHPFMDGNGRCARLLEKWFLTSHLGKEAWKIASEEYYWTHRGAYYKNINLGVNYWTLDYSKRMSFLEMLARVVRG